LHSVIKLIYKCSYSRDSFQIIPNALGRENATNTTMSLEQLLMAILSMAIWEALRRTGAVSLKWYRARDAFKKLLGLDGDVVHALSVLDSHGTAFVRDSDSEVERVVSTATGANVTHDTDGFVISNPAHHLVVIGSPRYNVTAREVQKYFALPYQFVFSSWNTDAGKRQVVVVTDYGDLLTSSSDQRKRPRAEDIDYGLLFLANLTNRKRVIWIAGIHGAGTLGVAQFLRTEASKVRASMPSKPNSGIVWLIRVKYQKQAGKSQPLIVSSEALGSSRTVSFCKGPRAKVVICDFGSVIMDFDRSRTYRAIGHALGRPFDAVQNTIEETDIRQRYETGELDTDAFVQELYNIIRCNEAQLPPAMLKEFWGDIFWEKPHMREALRELRQQGVPLILLSNTNELHFEHVSKDYPDLFSLFDEIVVSYRVKAAKPQRDIFDKALDAARRLSPDLNVSDVVFIDDESEYVQVAEGMGMRGFTYRSFSQFVFWLRQQGLYVA